MFPTSSPRALSKIAEIGKEIGKVRNMKKYINQVVCAPTISAYLEKTAYGMISPKIVIMAVEIIKPIRPDVKSPMRIERAEFTVTLPRRIVHRSKLPLLLIGKIFSAYRASYASCSLLNGPFVSSSKFFTSRPNNPRLSPEKVPERRARKVMIANCSKPTEGVSSTLASPSRYLWA
jgi:hypothetical protein